MCNSFLHQTAAEIVLIIVLYNYINFDLSVYIARYNYWFIHE